MTLLVKAQSSTELSFALISPSLEDTSITLNESVSILSHQDHTLQLHKMYSFSPVISRSANPFEFFSLSYSNASYGGFATVVSLC